ncbi:MAG: hypothetical protein M3145_00140, partial [Pseudomonadota bacterium]|nr:hypothetical protein [Pseudomonadota bacterium]
MTAADRTVPRAGGRRAGGTARRRPPLHGLRPAALLALAAPGIALILFFFALPLALVVRDAFSDGLGAFGRVLGNPLFRQGLVGSAALTLTASLFSLVVGFAVALHLSRLS